MKVSGDGSFKFAAGFGRPAILLLSILMTAGLFSCSSMYFNTMEKVGVHKRDILVERVEKARDSQSDAQKQFKSALEQFESVIALKDTDLKQAYESLNQDYEDSKAAAQTVSSRISSVESVAQALFKEWAGELEEYKNADMKASSKRQLAVTRKRYQAMLATMKKAEKSMDPVLVTFHDNVLFLKHNLNAQAIGSLHGEFSRLKGEIKQLIETMNASIASSNTFIEGLKE
ncbi:MAG: DUF2959 domain-containing protein [Pseudomonadota bacterium]